jgi:hypothetical protein
VALHRGAGLGSLFASDKFPLLIRFPLSARLGLDRRQSLIEHAPNSFRSAQVGLPLLCDPGIKAIQRIIMKAHIDGRSDAGSWRPSPSSLFCGANNC